MKRHYYLHDAKGHRKLSESELPLRIGGASAGNVVLPNLNEDQLVACIALENGYAYIQPVGQKDANEPADLFLNDEHIVQSSWLKSGDRIQIGQHKLSWTVSGDKVVIELVDSSDQPTLHPPDDAPPGTPLVSNELPINTQGAPGQAAWRTPRKLIVGLLSVLLLIAIYLLMLIPLRFEFEPGVDEFTLSGFPPPLNLWGSRLVMPGRYTVSATSAGYAPLTSDININRNSNTTLNFKLQELPGLLNISVQPEVNFALYVDDKEVALNEQGQASIDRGTHTVRIQASRHLPHQQTLEIKGFGELQEQHFDLQAAWATVSLSSQPAGAEIYLDGESIGQTPLEAEIMQGKHQLEFQSRGFKPAILSHEITAGENMILEPVQLQPLDGELTLNSRPQGASVTLDGNYVGTTPITLPVSANQQHELQLSKAGFQTLNKQAQLEAEEVRTLDFTLEAEYGTLFISTRPADVEVRLDGKPVDIQGGRLRISTQTHQLTFSKAGYQTHTQSITPSTGASQHIEVALKAIRAVEPVEEKSQASPAQVTTQGGQSLQLITPQSVLIMGASRREAGRRANENRRHVRLQRPFYFAHRETTNKEYRQFKATHDSGSLDGTNLNGDMQPVVRVSWEDSARYCNWLSQQHGLPSAYRESDGKLLAVQPMNTGYRLPTEAEWAWVARRLDREREQRYPWEGTYPPAKAAGNYADAQIADTLADVVPGYDDGYRGTAPVGHYPQWPAGFYDLGGNVAEWVHDYYTLYPGQSNQEVIDPLGPPGGTHHSIRGSGWRHGNITELRLSYRDYGNKPRSDLGFRIARYAN